MIVFDDGYVGLAPVPGERRNIGIVLGPGWRTRLARDGAVATTREVLGAILPTADDGIDWLHAEPCDRIAGASPLGGRVTRRAGPGWFLVGDAAGFLDPFTGEGLHRALVSSELAARAISAALGNRADGADARAPRRTTGRCAAGSRRRTSSRGSSNRSSRVRSCSSTRPDGSRVGAQSVRRWVS